MKVEFLLSKHCELPIWIFKIGALKIGVLNSDCWVVDIKGQIEVASVKNIMGFLPLLELDRRVVSAHLEEVWAICTGLNSFPTFPEDLLLRCALESSVSDYWPSKSLDWMSEGISENIRDILVRSSELPWANQKINHRIAKILKSDTGRIQT
ncbi:hypothetical protein [Acidovorax sp. NCPPB 3576]|uniref:hypothetical protein n=1 Tax=Acidovorax sp. NCPPB 3576 TaxID=2940488 RepID=UPI002349D07B|nr:hypothetical protein [Acidovorax sp. NCPPB 3576]WCM88102.1 hypothetical protein M5C98_22645 [Acidovorax sp. NCPPB 3576]